MVSFTDLTEGCTAVLPPRSLRHISTLLKSPRLARHMLSLRRLVENQATISRERDFSVTLRQYFEDHAYPASFGPEFAFPFLAACWGAPLDRLPEFPVYSLLKGMPPGKKLGFYEVLGGMSRYIEAFGRDFDRVELRLGVGVKSIDRQDQFIVEDEEGGVMRFDRLIVGTSARDAAKLLQGVPAVAEMQSALDAFRHFEIDIVVHGDKSFMPPNRLDWAHNNLFFDGNTAWMSDWQGIHSDVPVIRSWLTKGRALPHTVYGKRSFHHVLMTPENALLQRRIAAIQGAAGLFVTGMYAVDVDNHESALLSALVPVRALAPRSPNLQRLLGAVAHDAVHRLDVLPSPLPAPPKGAPFPLIARTRVL